MKEKEKEKRICSVCGAEVGGDEVCEFEGKVEVQRFVIAVGKNMER